MRHSAYLLGVIVLGLLLFQFVTPSEAQNASTLNITRTAPFVETLVCSAANDTYIINAIVNLTNITGINGTLSCPTQLGLNYEIEFASHSEPNKTQINQLFVHDFTGATVQQRGWDFLPGETKDVRFVLPFQCPADLTPNINFQTCSAFFDQFIAKDEPLLFTLATGTRQCNEILANTTANFAACERQRSDTSNQFSEEAGRRVRAEEALKICERELHEPGGNCDLRLQEKDSIIDTERKLKEEKVPSFWLWLTILLIITEVVTLLWSQRWGSA